MKIDFRTEDALIVVAANKRTGLWANSTTIRGSKNQKSGGQLETVASTHSLLTVALVAALRNISNRDISSLLESTTRTKATVIVASHDKSFLQAIDAIVQHGQPTSGNRLRSGQNFLGILKEQLRRFNVVTRVPEESDKTALVLAAWANKSLAAPKLIDGIPPVLTPSVITTNV